MDEAKGQSSKAETDAQSSKEKVRELESKVIILEQQLDTLKSQIAEEKSASQQLTAEHKAAQQALAAQLSAEQKKASQLPILEQQLEQAKYEVESLRSKEQRLENDMMMQRESFKRRQGDSDLKQQLQMQN